MDKLKRIRGYLNSLNPNRRILQTERGGAMVYHVPSQTSPGVVYDVFVDPSTGQWICTPCRDFAECQEPCKHIFEVLDRFFRDSAPPLDKKLLAKIVADRPTEAIWYADARRFPHEPYLYQDGPAESTRIDHAYEEQSERILDLLIDLKWVMDRRHPRPAQRGRPPLSAGERVLMMAFRRELHRSIRVFRSDAKKLAKEGFIAFAPGRTTWVQYQTSLEMLDLLTEAFRIVTAPFRQMERHVLVDSTGFSPFYASNWRDSDYGSVTWRPRTHWYKQHVVVGRLSKAILGLCFTPSFGPGTGDSTNLMPLIRDLRARDFMFDTVIADNIYLDQETLLQTKAAGVRLVGPLKPRNFDKKTGLAKPFLSDITAFRDADPDAYDELVRGRNAIEGVFSVEKREDNHIAAIGTEVEREKYRQLSRAAAEAATEMERNELRAKAASAGMYVSRRVECLTRAIVQVLRRTVHMEHLYNRRVSYRRETLFSQMREYSPVDDHA